MIALSGDSTLFLFWTSSSLYSLAVTLVLRLSGVALLLIWPCGLVALNCALLFTVSVDRTTGLLLDFWSLDFGPKTPCLFAHFPVPFDCCVCL